MLERLMTDHPQSKQFAHQANETSLKRFPMLRHASLGGGGAMGS
jgi:hypothetical protein